MSCPDPSPEPPPRRVIFLGLALCLAPASARPDSFENVPAGSRTAAMGGAALAGGYDSAMPILNPAGLARVPGSVLSVSASLYQLGRVEVPAFASDGGSLMSPWGELAISQPGISSAEFSSFPSGIAYMLHVDSPMSMVFAGSLSVPRSIRRRFVQSFELTGNSVTIRDSYTTIIDEQQYVAALSWAGALGRLRVGASVLGSYTTRLQSVSREGLVVLGTANFARDQAADSEAITSADVGVLVGAQLDVGSHLRVGVTARSPSINVYGDYSSTVDATLLDSATDSVVANVISTGSAQRGLPMRFAAGVEVYGEGWTVALDGSVWVPRADEYRASGTTLRSAIGMANEQADTAREFSIAEPTHVTFNVAAGFELRLTDSHWLRGGLFTDFSAEDSAEARMIGLATQRRPAPRNLFTFPIDKFGGSLGWGTKVGSVDTTIGARATYGAGQTLRYVPDERYSPSTHVETTGASMYEVVAFLSATLDLSDGAAGMLDHLGEVGE